MQLRLRGILGSVAALSLFAAGALAQSLSINEVPELESDRLVNEGLVEVKILEIDRDARTLTVRFEENEEMAKLIVPESAEIIRTFPNNVQREIELGDLNAGDDIMVQAVVVEGVIHLRIIGIAV